MDKQIRKATFLDTPRIQSLDENAVGPELNRSRQIAESVNLGECTVLEMDGYLLAFSLSRPKAHEGEDFLELLVVDPSSRRQGLATALLDEFLSNSSTSKFWTSTNQSNHPMVELLRKAGWVQSHQIEELDQGDPEVYFYAFRPAASNS